MSGFNGSGLFFFTYSWTNDAANGIPITASRMDAQFNDAVGGFDLCMTRDGQGAATANIPFAAGLTTDIVGPFTPNGPISLTAGQILFPVTQNNSANVNTLDDYREGTFTPTISFGGASVGVTYLLQSGSYTKIGNSIRIRISITLSNKGSSVGNILISGLPYTNSSAFSVAGAIRLGGSLAAINVCQGYVNSSSPTITLEKLVSGSATILQDTDVGSTVQIGISAEYPTA